MRYRQLLPCSYAQVFSICFQAYVDSCALFTCTMAGEPQSMVTGCTLHSVLMETDSPFFHSRRQLYRSKYNINAA